MESLPQRFRRHLEATGLIPAGSRVLVAVSGGADSVALLHLLHGVAGQRRLALHAAHLDHALRPDSPADAAHVRDLCAALAVPLTVRRVDVAALARSRKGGLEQAAREARRAFLEEVAREQACDRIALAHQCDDQAETVLLRLLRGAGVTGLAGMRPADLPYVRPLLPFGRDELVAWLAAAGIAWREDPSNRDPAFARNRVRHELLPLLEGYNPAIRARLAELSRQLAAEEDDWAARVAAELAATARLTNEECRLPCAALAAASPALAGRLVRAALREVRGDLRRIEAAHVAAILALAGPQGRPQGELHLPGAWVGRRYAELVVRREPPQAVSQPPLVIDGPGRYLLADGRQLIVSLTDRPGGETPGAVEFDPRQVGFPLQVRAPQPGDRLRPAGMTGTKKLQDLFVDGRLPAEARAAAVLVLAGGTLLWVAGLRRCAGLRPAAGAPALRLELAGPGAGRPQSA